jgi:hypothetical protein
MEHLLNGSRQAEMRAGVLRSGREGLSVLKVSLQDIHTFLSDVVGQI